MVPANTDVLGNVFNLETSWRSRTAKETLAAMAPLSLYLQILDLVEHTLEAIPSIPIYEAVRQSNPAGYFCLGKGFSADASQASAVMEAAEMALVEQPRVEAVAVLGDLAFEALIARPGWQQPLARREWDEPLDPCTPMLAGRSLAGDQVLYVPETDLFYRPGSRSSAHGPSTNGLASGNTWSEALVHGLCELLERDALQRWSLRCVLFPPQLVEPLPDPAWDDSLNQRIAQIQEAGWHVVLTRLPCSHPVVVMETLLLRALPDGRVLSFSGWGCHPEGLVATKRALAESVQILAMHVAIRDGRLPASRLPGVSDRERQRGLAVGNEANFARLWGAGQLQAPPRIWSLRSGPEPEFPPPCLCRDGEELLTVFKAPQLGQAFTVCVSPPELPFVALRTVAPALRSPAGL